MLNKNTLITGVCSSYSNEGEGIIKLNKEVIFVKGLLLNEKADINIDYTRNKINYGSIKKIYSCSPDRIVPKCSVCTSCGGCQFQVLNYEKQLEFKTNKVLNALKFIGKINTIVNPCIGLKDPYYYRNKIQMPLGKIKNKIVSGFYKNNTHKIIPIDECYIENKTANKIISSIKKIMQAFKIEPYDEDKRVGIIRHILIRTSYHFNEIMVVLVTNQDTYPSRNNFIHQIIKENPEITTVIQNTNKRDTNVILGENEKVLYGKGFIKDSILGINFNISSKSFFQINPVQTENLYSYIANSNLVNKDDIVLDAYCGVGTIGMCVSKFVKHVIGVEIVKESIIDARKNARNNNITNIDFVCEDATNYILENKINIDVLIMDPPRKGSTPEFLKSIIKLKPRNIIYVSCDPNTLARDLIYLKNDYEILSVQPFDMFPMTHHVETVLLLQLKEQK